jgi:predicted RNase H-like HicB family nuclease
MGQEFSGEVIGRSRWRWSVVPRAKRNYTLPMRNDFTAVIEQDGEWYVGWSREIPGANGQGHTAEECRASIDAAIRLIQTEDRRAYTSS